MEEMFCKSDYIWRALAKSDCQESVNTVYEIAIAFPDLLAFSDDIEKLQNHIGKICELLHLNEPWEKNNGT